MTAGNGGAPGNGGPGSPLAIIVDGANVVGSRPDGWWRDRAGAAVRLHDNLAKLAERGRQGIPARLLATNADETEGRSPDVLPVEVILVLEGAARAAAPRITERARTTEDSHQERNGGDSPPGTVQVVSAPASGDDEIVRLAGARPGRCIVVTADRELRRRCLAAGARVAGPSWLYGLM